MAGSFVTAVIVLAVCGAVCSSNSSTHPVEVECVGDGDSCTICSHDQGNCSPLENVPEIQCQDTVLHEDSCTLAEDPVCGDAPCANGNQWNAGLTYTFSYQSSDSLYLELQWTPDPDVGSYFLILTAKKQRRKDCLMKRRYICITQLNQNDTSFRYPVRFGRGVSDNQLLHATLIPDEWCAGPSVAIDVPNNCYNMCPGMCACIDTSNSPGYHFLYPPKEVRASSQFLNKSASLVSISWEQGEKYYKPHSHMTFSLSINSGAVTVSEGIAVVGKTNVSLYFLGMDSTQTLSFVIKIREYICGARGFYEVSGTLVVEPHTETPHSAVTQYSSPVVEPHTETPHGAVTYSSSLVVEPHTLTETPHSAASSLVVESHTESMVTPKLYMDSGITNTLTLSSSFRSGTSADGSTGKTRTPLLIYTAPIILVLVLVISILSIVLIILRVRKNALKSADDSPEGEMGEKKVLVLFSEANSTYDRECILENLVKVLARYGVQCMYFDLPCVRGSVAQWVVENIESCSKVILVCNKQFALEWKSASIAKHPRGDSVVYVLQQVIHSYVKNDKEKLEKFGILYLRRKDRNCTDCPFLKNMKSFLVDPQDSTQIEQTVRFIYDSPTYQMCSPQLGGSEGQVNLKFSQRLPRLFFISTIIIITIIITVVIIITIL